MKTLYSALEGLKDCSKFLKLVRQAKLEKLLSGSRNFTLFAPNNKGVDCIDDERMLVTDAQRLVKYHLVPGKIKLIDLVPYKLRKTLQGTDICLEAVSVQVNASLIVRSNLECKNGVIHVVDTILVPKNVSCEPTKNYFNVERMSRLTTPSRKKHPWTLC